jgi:hypothetical protein
MNAEIANEDVEGTPNSHGRSRRVFDEFAGALSSYPSGYLDALRDEWDRDRPIATAFPADAGPAQL